MRLAMRRLSLIPAEALSVTFLPSPGPGGQNVNKVETAVRLSLDLARAELPDAMRLRLVRLAGRRVSQAGVLSITASRHRTQEANRRDALARLEALLAEAAHPPRPRKATKPTRASAERRLTAKAHRGRAKATRGRPPPD
jgi:ribosome-associated protein